MMKKLLASSLVAALLLAGSVSSAFAYDGNREDQKDEEKAPVVHSSKPARAHAKPAHAAPVAYKSAPAAQVASKPTPAPAASAAPAQTAKPAPAPAATAASSSQADKVIAFAQSLQGKVHYGYAKRVTSNPNNMLLDCSSYTQYVYKQAIGLYMPWGANAQHNAFPHVAKADLKKGDLLFFSVGSGKGIGHVGIYMGGGKFIHNVNPSSNVTIGDLNSGYYQRHYIDASRPLK